MCICYFGSFYYLFYSGIFYIKSNIVIEGVIK